MMPPRYDGDRPNWLLTALPWFTALFFLLLVALRGG